MSAPDTNLEKQRERHKPSLLGIKGALVFGLLMLILIVAWSLMSGADSGATAYEGTDVNTTAPVVSD